MKNRVFSIEPLLPFFLLAFQYILLFMIVSLFFSCLNIKFCIAEAHTGPDEVCVSKWGFIIALVITALLALVAVAVAVSCWLMAYRSKPKHSGPLPHPSGFPNPLFTTPQPLAEPSPDYLS